MFRRISRQLPLITNLELPASCGGEKERRERRGEGGETGRGRGRGEGEGGYCQVFRRMSRRLPIITSLDSQWGRGEGELILKSGDVLILIDSENGERVPTAAWFGRS